MQKHGSSENGRGVLSPRIPTDIGARSQRRRIIDAMIESCAEKTYPATTIADIVRTAGISRTTFYKRFEGKRDCFDAALDACVEELRTAMESARTASDRPAETVRKAVAALLDLLAAEPARAQLVLCEAVSVDPAAMARHRTALIPATERLFEAGGERGQPHADARLAFGRAQVLIFNAIATGRTEELPELLPELVYVALLPFVGHEEATMEARLADLAAEAVEAPAPGDDRQR